MTAYESIYKGATYLLDPGYRFTGYRVRSGEMGGTTSIQTANQLKEVDKLLNNGMKVTEVSTINIDVFEMIPKDQLKEIYRLNKLVGAESTLHAPTLDPSGFGEQGWSEEQREMVERQFTDVVKRSHDLNPKGNVPVTIHASVIPGSEIIPEKDKEGKNKFGRIVAVDRETGKFVPLEREKRFYPDEPEELSTGGRVYEPQEELIIANNSYWDNQLSQLVYYKKEGDNIIEKNWALVKTIFAKHPEGLKKEDMDKLDLNEQIALQNITNGEIYLKNTQQSLNSLFNQAYKCANDATKEKLKGAAEEFKQDYEIFENSHDLDAWGRALQGLISNMREITDSRYAKQHGLEVPKKYVPVEEFAKDKASQTLGEVAFKAYKQFGNTAPIISIENPPYGQAIATGQDLKELVIKTRDEFVRKLVSEGKSESEAQKAAEKLIGATWDTSHMSMIRKQGFGPERIVEDTKAIAPFVKHVHFNDNFGSSHTDLPPGMGSLPFKDILEVLEKNKFKGKKVFEGGNFFQHFQKSPFPYQLSYSGSPIFDNAAPYWNQVGGPMGNYFAGRGPVFTSGHFNLYGASFSGLPAELGGEASGSQGRFSGAPNQ